MRRSGSHLDSFYHPPSEPTLHEKSNIRSFRESPVMLLPSVEMERNVGKTDGIGEASSEYKDCYRFNHVDFLSASVEEERTRSEDRIKNLVMKGADTAQRERSMDAFRNCSPKPASVSIITVDASSPTNRGLQTPTNLSSSSPYPDDNDVSAVTTDPNKKSLRAHDHYEPSFDVQKTGVSNVSKPIVEASVQMNLTQPQMMLLEQPTGASTTLSPKRSISTPPSSPKTSPSPTSLYLPRDVSLNQLRASPGGAFSFPRRSQDLTRSPASLHVHESGSSSATLLLSVQPDSENTTAIGRNQTNVETPLNPNRKAFAFISPAHLSTLSSADDEIQIWLNIYDLQAPVQPRGTDDISSTASSSPPHQLSSTPAAGARPQMSPKYQPYPIVAGLSSSHDQSILSVSPVGMDAASLSQDLPSSINSSPSTSTQLHHQYRMPESQVSHSRSFSSLSTLSGAGSFRTKRRPSLPNTGAKSDKMSQKSVESLRDAVIRLQKTDFEFVTPNIAGLDLQGSHNASTSSNLTEIAATSTDYVASMNSDTDSGWASESSSRLIVTQPSATAKDRVRSVYIQDQFAELSPSVDEYGFIKDSRRSDLEMGNYPPHLKDSKALEAYRARELKVRWLCLSRCQEGAKISSQWVQVMNQITPASAKKSKKIKKLVAFGIPSSVRGKAWVRAIVRTIESP